MDSWVLWRGPISYEDGGGVVEQGGKYVCKYVSTGRKKEKAEKIFRRPVQITIIKSFLILNQIIITQHMVTQYWSIADIE